MSIARKRATIYIDPEIHRALRVKAAETSTSMSDLVNDAVKASLAEDAEDLSAFEEKAGDRLVGYEEMVKKLKKDGLI
jgi:plasmid stability protein